MIRGNAPEAAPILDTPTPISKEPHHPMTQSIVDFGPTPSGPTAHSSTLPGSAFALLGLRLPLVRALVEEGYELPTPVQGRAIPPVLDGRDLLACAQTGT